MTDNKPSDTSTDDFQETADKSLDTGIADESVAYAKAIETDDADDEVAEGKWKSSDDGSGTSETDLVAIDLRCDDLDRFGGMRLSRGSFLRIRL